jgi:hypothetical protein
VRALRSVPARFVTCEAAIAEASYGLENLPAAVRGPGRLIARMDVVSFAPDRLELAFDAAEQWAPRTDFADA